MNERIGLPFNENVIRQTPRVIGSSAVRIYRRDGCENLLGHGAGKGELNER